MTKGKNSSAVNARLREELKTAQEARRRLEARIAAAEAERDAAVGKLHKIEVAAHPAIEAERLRAEHAAAEREAAVVAERERWQALIEQARPMFRRMVTHMRETDAQVIDFEGIKAFGDLFGPELFASYNRTMRRNTMSAAEAKKAANRARSLGVFADDDDLWASAGGDRRGRAPRKVNDTRRRLAAIRESTVRVKLHEPQVYEVDEHGVGRVVAS